ncbi:unnamed protein product [Moneuplotes crassus]|uniref:Uncharacterized protein n=1 Tax=Euplotes crassus TaxID=5936 RepID=A0AAD1YBQ6_EUPCR|nr:unnamed protein product [Moneuplotes crassus]
MQNKICPEKDFLEKLEDHRGEIEESKGRRFVGGSGEGDEELGGQQWDFGGKGLDFVGERGKVTLEREFRQKMDRSASEEKEMELIDGDRRDGCYKSDSNISKIMLFGDTDNAVSLSSIEEDLFSDQNKSQEESKNGKVDKSFINILLKKIRIEGNIKEVMRSIVSKEYVETQEYRLEFNIWRCIKIFIYHMCWFFFGYLFGFVMLLIEGKNLTENMGFLLGHQVKLGAHQAIAYLSFISYMVLSIFSPNYWWFGDTSRKFLIVMIMCRSFVIGVRYGFMSTARYRLLRSKANYSWIRSDLLLFGWLELTPKTLKEEINASKARIEIDNDQFEFTFWQDIPKSLDQKLSKQDYYDRIKPEGHYKNIIHLQKEILAKMKLNNNCTIDDELDLIHNPEITVSKTMEKRKLKSKIESFINLKLPNSVEDLPRLKTKKIYKGEPILREMGLLESSINNSFLPIYFIVIVRLILPTLSSLIEHDFKFPFEWYEYILILLEGVLILVVYGANLSFMFAGIIDFKRKLFFMKILNSLISFEKDKKFVFSSYFPTLNVCSINNLSSWLVLRESCLDLGRKYTQRIFIYCSVFMFFYLTLFVFMVLCLLKFLEYELSLGFYIVGAFDIIVVLGIMLNILRMGAKVNKYFNIHKRSLLSLKKQVWKARNNYGIAISQRYSGYIKRKRFAEMLISMNLKKDKRNDYLDRLLEQINVINEELDFFKETNPLKLMGLTASDQLLNSIYTGLVSVAFALAQSFYQDLGNFGR